MTDRLFVYGTLAPGKPNEHVLADVPGTWEPASVRGTLLQRGWGAALGYPGIIPDERGEEIKGLIFSSEVLAAHWPRLDEFEGDGYERARTSARLQDGTVMTAYIYRLSRRDSMSSHGIVRLESPYTFAGTLQQLLAAFSEKSIKVFATIDQQAEARAVGLAMPPTTLIVFGNPKAGTPLMLANPLVGIDLPLKVLVCESEPGQVAVLFTAASEIIERHSLPPELVSNLAPAERLIATVLSRDPKGSK